jgi:drug/metabolite transporter (DMT)-like permease
MNSSYIPALLFALGTKIVPFLFLCAAILIFSRKKNVPSVAFLLGCILTVVVPYASLFTQGVRWGHIQHLFTTVAYLLQGTGLLFYALSIPKTSD